jgi:hypothetical protein
VHIISSVRPLHGQRVNEVGTDSAKRCCPSAVRTENSNPNVVMVKPTEDWVRTNHSGLMSRTRNRRGDRSSR